MQENWFTPKPVPSSDLQRVIIKTHSKPITVQLNNANHSLLTIQESWPNYNLCALPSEISSTAAERGCDSPLTTELDTPLSHSRCPGRQICCPQFQRLTAPSTRHTSQVNHHSKSHTKLTRAHSQTRHTHAHTLSPHHHHHHPTPNTHKCPQTTGCTLWERRRRDL